MISFRPFRNFDPPALAKLWNRSLPGRNVARPLSAHTFDALIVGKLHFDPAGLIVAERNGRIVGFVHAGFAPERADGPSHRLSYELGTVGLLVVEDDLDDAEVEMGLMVQAERYLVSRGASVIYAGGQYPLNPFYWGVYGGSEWPGILGSHRSFLRAVERAGYEPASTAVLLELDLNRSDVRDPLGPVHRRRVRFEVSDDTMMSRWWDALAIGQFRPTAYRLVNRVDDTPLAWATTWDMSASGQADNRGRLGLIALEVDVPQRRKGYGRHMVFEILRHGRDQLAGTLVVQTMSTNLPALALYQSIGFEQTDTATLFRLPVRQGLRRAGESIG